MRLYVTAFITGAGALLALQLLDRPAIEWGEVLFFLILALAAESAPVHLPQFSMTVSFMIAVVAIIELDPAAVTMVSGLGVFGTLLAGDRPSPHKLAFNSAQIALASGLAASTYRALGGATLIEAGSLAPMIGSVLVAAGVYFVVNSLAVSGAIGLSSGAPFGSTWVRNFSWLVVTYPAFGAFGLVLAALYQFVGLFAVPMLLVPFLVARSVFRSYQEVSQAYESTILAFVNAMEAKDVYTRGHSERVAEYATMLAKGVGMDEDELQVFRYAALLHDVGKLAVRRAILTKPGGLDDGEYEEIKKHPGLGAQIVAEIDFLRPALDAVLYHHERLDGSGYPAGLAGDAVSKTARIMGIADTFDAMTSTRAYRGAHSPQEAAEELRRCAGELFDEAMVEEFLERMEQQDIPETIERRVRREHQPLPSSI